MAKKPTYGVADVAVAGKISVPDLPYRPQDPKHYRPAIGLIGCGGITQSHLTAYRAARYDIVALCDHNASKAEARRAEFCPRARVYTDYRELLKRDDIKVVDVATHPVPRVQIVREALEAGKHVLSQKPFVLDLDVGRELCDLADRKGVRLAVNQNARWAPHFSYLRQVILCGLIGRVTAVHMGVHWDHGWTAGTAFEDVRHLVLYDFAIHWFDILTQLMGGRSAKRVFASVAAAPGQKPKPPMLGQALIEYDDAQASAVFDAATPVGPLDTTYVVGTAGTAHSIGPDYLHQKLTVHTRDGHFSPVLKGKWFPDGFHGTMGELLCAIEENRQPLNNARDNLTSLALCFAAVRSADTGQPQSPGQIRRLEL